MHKYFSYILILVALAGIFSPMVHVQAQAPAPATSNSNYVLLAPLPNDNGQIKNFDTSTTTALSTYLNLMIKLIIGLSAVMAVVMIVIGGMEYMTSELMHSKEHGRERMTNAVLGLLLALGAYTLLYTINPDLLNSNLSSLTSATVEVALTQAVRSDAGRALPTGPISGCAGGMQRTTNDMAACADGNLVQNVNNLLASAKSAGLNITGGGYRSLEEQRAIRIANCNGDFTNPNASCRPPTAIPGQSNHNYGKAFDLQCDGVLIQTSDNKCFIWLQNNAGKYGLRNLPSERWHWSTDGR